MRFLILIAILFTSCCRFVHEPVFNVDSELLPYLSEFEQLSAREKKPLGRTQDLVMVFVDSFKEIEVLGKCTIGAPYMITPVVRISREHWEYLTDMAKEQLVYHELGHCLLYRGHTETYTTIDGKRIPKSVMISYEISDNTYTTNRAYYIHELFNP